ncbi:hypothetical protein [Undibacterium terreum]|uniref:Lipoprotein n=1 Tax=Undibacterium terreum TaxID=1224302 RepID=A0A916XNT1_9BURK|nr:hypothetical protein [Undibacterium terreum]GGC86581.1 hypothetical protein GCM10011396_37360 [Undibacterium terreum]
MNKFSISLLSVLTASTLAACSNKTDLNQDNISAGLTTYLAKRGDLCLAKNVWPIDVTQKDVDTGGRNAIQMPILEKLGLAQSSVATVTATEEGVSAEIKVRRYTLTENGKKYYLNKEMRSVRSDGDIKLQQGDLCAAKLSLDKVIGWEEAKTNDSSKMVAVSYTYKVDAAPWTADADIQKVFPMVDRVVRGAGSMVLKESFKLTGEGWVAVDL